MVRKYRKYDNHLFDMISKDLLSDTNFCEIAHKNCTNQDCLQCKAYIELMNHMDNPKSPA